MNWFDRKENGLIAFKERKEMISIVAIHIMFRPFHKFYLII